MATSPAPCGNTRRPSATPRRARSPTPARGPRPTPTRIFNSYALKARRRSIYWLARPELALVIGAVLHAGFDRVWGILLDERSIRRRERLPRAKSRSGRIAGLCEPCPRSHDLIRDHA